MKKLLFFALLICTLHASAQNARSILDKTSEKVTAAGNLKFKFKAMQFQGTVPDSGAEGTMFTDGKRYHIDTEELLVWYNGEQTWTLMKGSNEVNISAPTAEEQAVTNIHVLLSIYKSGYKLSAKKSTLRGLETYEVRLKAKNKKQGFEELFIDVNRKSYMPLCIRAKKDGNWMRISIYEMHTAQKFSDAQFNFPKQQYPDVEVIDLR